jgi:hypothetical protein
LEGESGATMLILSVSFTALLAISALVVDLGLTRLSRSEARIVVDNAAAAGALVAEEGDGIAGCLSALGYVEENLGVRFAGIDCSQFTGDCKPASTTATETDGNGDWALAITYPVPDGHPLLVQSAIGSSSQPVDLKDGLPCDRIGISLQKTHTNLFGSLFGNDTTVTEVHAVGATRPATVPTLAVNLVILERYDCDALVLEGGGSSDGGIYIDVVVEPDGTLSPGHATVDSDGTGANCGSDGTLAGNGIRSIIRADGIPGCPEQTGTHVGPGGRTVGESCGEILLYAPGTPGCNPPACTTRGTVSPDPTTLTRRITRAPIDHRYNCKGDYAFPAGWEIRPCTDATAPHIDNLVAAHGGSGAPPGFKTWRGLGHRCTVDGPSTVIPVNGDVYVDCDPLIVRGGVHLTGGDVVFAGDVIVESSGLLVINGEQGGDPWTPGLDSVTVFMQGGLLRKAGTASFVAHNSMIYMTATSELQMEGGSGALIWTAASKGIFDNLALWSESPLDHSWAGNAFLDLQGIFFSPKAMALYRGSGGQVQVKAQFVTRKLNVSGNGILVVSPRYNSAVLIPEDVVQLIR